jgi:hypothetical protein
MQRLRSLLPLLKKHYEKVLLVACVLVLMGNVWFLYDAKQNDAIRREDNERALIRKGGKPVPPVDLARFDAVLSLMKSPPSLSLAKPNHLFSPVTWYRAADGSLVKVRSEGDIGMRKMEVTAVRPLDLSIALIKAATSGSGAGVAVSGYHMVTTNETVAGYKRRTTGLYALNETNKPVFILREVKGPPEAPTEMIVELKEFPERVSLTPEKPYVRILAYEADLKYAPTGRTYLKKRKNDPLDISGQPHKIMDITADKVVLSDDSNGAVCDLKVNSAP